MKQRMNIENIEWTPFDDLDMSIKTECRKCDKCGAVCWYSDGDIPYDINKPISKDKCPLCCGLLLKCEIEDITQ